MPGPGEERLDGDRPAEDEAEVERDLRHDRQARARHDVPPAHRERPQPDRARGHHVVGVHDVGDRGACDEDVLADLAEREHDRRQDQVRCRRPGCDEARRAPPGVALRPPGNQARVPAKRPMKIMPIQKSGIE